MFNRISVITMFAALLTACGVGGSDGSQRSPVNVNTYGNLQGQAIPYTGSLLDLYTPENLQNFIITDPAIVAKLGGTSAFGVCNSLESGPLGKSLCASNKLTLAHNPNYSTVFTAGRRPTNVNNFVTNGAQSLGITQVQPYRIIYDTAGGSYQFAGNGNSTQTVSAAVLVPEQASGIPLPVSQIKGVLLYFHPTVISKGGVPSDFDGTLTPNFTKSNTASVTQTNAITAFTEDAMLAAVYAAQGFIVIAPDYVGQGINYQVQHPYVIFGPNNAQAGLNALKAARTALNSLGINLPNPAKLYISSYSEGGAYALWASNLAQTTYADFLATNGFILRRTVGVSGAYDLTGAMLHYEFANANNSVDSTVNVWNVSPGLTDSSKPASVLGLARAAAAFNLATSKTALAGYVLTALAYYNSSSASLNVLAPFYAPMNNCLDLVTYLTESTATPQQANGKCSLPYDLAGLYNTPGLTQGDIGGQSFAAASSYQTGYLTGGKTFRDLFKSLAEGYVNNSVASFVQPGILTDPTIMPFVAQNNIQSWVSSSPIDILFLNYDSVVTNINALEACGNLPSSAQFPGYQPGYTGGVKQLSPAGMVTCINLANNGVGTTLSPLFTQFGGLPLIVDHSQAEAVLQILALNNILANP